MSKLLLPSTLGRIAIDEWQFPPHIQALQRAVIDTLYDRHKNRLIVEFPVRHGKSFYCSYVLAAWYILTHPNSNCWIVCYGSDFAQEWSSKIRTLVRIWGKVLTGVEVDPSFASMSHFRLKRPHRGELRGLGIWGAIAGKGAHLIIADDLVKEFGEVATEEAREKLYRQFMGELIGRLEPGGKIVIVMSRRHPDDLSGKLLDSNHSLAPDKQWQRIKFPALSADDSTALWPERYSVEDLKQIRRDHQIAGTEYQWWSLYMQDPATAAELCEWPAAYWTDLFYDELPRFTPRFRLMSLDPSFGKHRRKGDFSALLYGLVDSDGCLWIDDPILIRTTTDNLETLAASMLQQHKPDAMCIEVNGLQGVIATNIHKRVPTAQIYPYESEEVKEIRIRMMLTPLLAQRKLRIRDTPQGRIMGRQFRDFPLASHDDGPDAVALMVQLWRDLLGKAGQAASGNMPVTTT